MKTQLEFDAETVKLRLQYFCEVFLRFRITSRQMDQKDKKLQAKQILYIHLETRNFPNADKWTKEALLNHR